MLAWVDLESSGLDPIDDEVLEVGLILTERTAPFVEVARYESLVRPLDPTWRNRMVNVVREMHTRNGLLADIDDGAGRDLNRVDLEVAAMLSRRGAKPGQVTLAGSGVGHFDKAFIDARMPTTAAYLHYAVLDVGVIRRAMGFAGRKDLQRAGGTYEGDAFADKPHRALPDALDHLEEWRHYAAMLFSIKVAGEAPLDPTPAAPLRPGSARRLGRKRRSPTN